MQIKDMTIDQVEREYLLYCERESKPFAPRKSWTWRRKFDFILDTTELRYETAVQCCRAPEMIDAEKLDDYRRAILAMRRLFHCSYSSTSDGRPIGYAELLRNAELRLEAYRQSESIAFIAQYEVLVFRLRHLDARL